MTSHICPVILDALPCIYFFFQAEDGIRDGTVTGVQTCALPISWKARHGDPRAVSRRIPEPSRAEVRHLSLRIRRVGRTQKGTEYSFTPNESGREKAEAGESAPRPTRVRYKSYAETAADPADRDSEPGGPGGHCFAPMRSADARFASESGSRAWPPSCRKSCVRTDSPDASPPGSLPRSPNDAVPLSCNARARCLGSAVRSKSKRGAPSSTRPQANSQRSLPSFLHRPPHAGTVSYGPARRSDTRSRSPNGTAASGS